MEEDNSKDVEDAVMVTHGSAGLPGLLACRSFETYEYHVLCLYIQLLVCSSSVYQLFENKSFLIERKDKRGILLEMF